jgi:hypothetical protein
MKYIILLAFLLINPVTQAEWKSFFDGTKTIHLKFTDVINDKYTVNAVWAPIDDQSPRLVGPATISFLKGSNYLFSVSANEFHLPYDELEKLGVLKVDDEGQAVKVDLNKVYSFEYHSKSFNKISLMNNTHKYEVSGSTEQTPFFFEDIDFDGKDELIVVNFNTLDGQRWFNTYSIYKPTYKYGNIYNLVNTEPFNIIDQLTTFDKDSKTTSHYYRGGSCSNSEDTYKMIGGQFEHIKYKKWRESTSKKLGFVCTESTYDIVDGKQVLESETDSFYDNYKHYR